VAPLPRANPKVQPVSEHARDRQAATEPGEKGQLQVSGNSEGEDFEDLISTLIDVCQSYLPSPTTITDHHH
jgi:hypothetical protein